jgi:hypothetical protein
MRKIMAAVVLLMGACSYGTTMNSTVGPTTANTETDISRLSTESESSVKDEQPSLVKSCEVTQAGSEDAHPDCVGFAKKSLPPPDGERKPAWVRAYPGMMSGFGYQSPYYRYGQPNGNYWR